MNCAWSGRSRSLQQRGEGKKKKDDSKYMISYKQMQYHCTWEDTVKTDLEETGWEFVYWIHLAHERY